MANFGGSLLSVLVFGEYGLDLNMILDVLRLAHALSTPFK